MPSNKEIETKPYGSDGYLFRCQIAKGNVLTENKLLFGEVTFSKIILKSFIKWH